MAFYHFYPSMASTTLAIPLNDHQMLQDVTSRVWRVNHVNHNRKLLPWLAPCCVSVRNSTRTSPPLHMMTELTGQGARKHAGIGHQVQGRQGAFVPHTTGAAFSTWDDAAICQCCRNAERCDVARKFPNEHCNTATTTPATGRGTIAFLAHRTALIHRKLSAMTCSLRGRCGNFGNFSASCVTRCYQPLTMQNCIPFNI